MAPLRQPPSNYPTFEWHVVAVLYILAHCPSLGFQLDVIKITHEWVVCHRQHALNYIRIRERPPQYIYSIIDGLEQQDNTTFNGETTAAPSHPIRT